MNTEGKGPRYRRNAPYARKPRLAWLYALVIAAAAIALLRIFVIEVVPVDGPSMEDTFFSNERILVNRLCYHLREPRRGEIVICRYPNDKDAYVKRVIALEGESVEVAAGEIWIDGAPLDERAYWRGDIYGDMERLLVPKGHIFVVGDNRNRSVDSRMPHVGPIPMELVNGKATALVWPFARIRLL